jgi:hypothetical protein
VHVQRDDARFHELNGVVSSVLRDFRRSR